MYDYQNSLNLLAGIVMILIGIIGIICNFFVVYIFLRAPVERTSFNLICVFRAVCNIIVLGWAFLATYVPVTFMGTSPYSLYYESIVLGCVNTIYTVIQNTGILIAVNRLCAVFFPFGYQKVFRIEFTILMTFGLFVWKAIVIVMEFRYYLPKHCYMYFSSEELTWMLTDEPQCYENSDSNVNKTAIYVGIMVVINLITLFKISLFYKSTSMIQARKDGKLRKNKVLFMQTLIQDAIMLFDMLFTFKLSLLINGRYWSFICGTLIWECVHSLDGFIMILFNERLTFIKRTLFSSSANPSMPNSKVFVSTTLATHLKAIPISRR